MILFGHQTGNPNAHHAALAHFEASRLDAFVVPWFPSVAALSVLRMFPPWSAYVARLERRRFEPLARAPKIQGRRGELKRLAMRALGVGDEGLSYEANDWVMRTMARACWRPSVTAVHAYEDASLWSFQEAKRQGKACIYDMPIGYYPAWEDSQAELSRVYMDWLPAGGLPSSRWVRPEQKRKEMELADLVLVPSSFVRRTIERFMEKRIVLASYGVDTEFWCPATSSRRQSGPMRFIYAGQCSIRKGTPLLLEAWKAAGLVDAELHLVGSWHLADSKLRELPDGVRYLGHVSSESLRAQLQNADVFVFPSFFEGFGLVVLEAMACGLPTISSDATVAVDIADESAIRIFPVGDVEMLLEHLRFFADSRGSLVAMGKAARAMAQMLTWKGYRSAVSAACESFG